AIYLLPQYNGLLLIASLAIFGTLTALWKEPNYKIAGLGALVLLSLLNIGVNGLKFGIDFSGGTRIPVLLEKPVDQATMSDLVQIVKARASILGLTEIKVRAVGDSQIYIETPSSDPEQIKFIEDVLSRQGVYTGVVDGKIAISGENIYTNSIRSINSQQVNADWAVGFSVNKEGGETFAKVVKGKGNYPLYMFLDRPNDAVILLSKFQLRANAPAEITDVELIKAINDSLRLEGNDIGLLLTEQLNLTSELNLTNKTRVILS
ncbi:hypothetical protein HZC08_00545, partial [Candidatus Micrarchaeota archaeon]|nr:hypothetical protein [Candidatus Micrarchaeota archaeon]